MFNFLRSERDIRAKATFAANAAVIVAASSTVDFIKRYPTLNVITNADWDAFVLTGCHWALRMSLATSGLPNKTRNAASSTLSEALKAHLPDIEERTAMLTTYVERAFAQSVPQNDSDGFRLVLSLVGGWSLAQMLDVAPSEVDPDAAHHLGAFMVVGFRDWWTGKHGS